MKVKRQRGGREIGRDVPTIFHLVREKRKVRDPTPNPHSHPHPHPLPTTSSPWVCDHNSVDYRWLLVVSTSLRYLSSYVRTDRSVRLNRPLAYKWRMVLWYITETKHHGLLLSHNRIIMP